MTTVLRGMQSLLGRLYDVDVQYDVSDFLVTDRRALGGITPDNDTRVLDEELLVAESADGAGVALYLDPALLQRLERADPLGALTEHNLADYCTFNGCSGASGIAVSIRIEVFIAGGGS